LIVSVCGRIFFHPELLARLANYVNLACCASDTAEFNIATGDSEVLTHWAGITPDGAPLALRSVKTSEIYALEWVRP
jgi:hypothetical protein